MIAINTDNRNDILKFCNFTVEIPELVTRKMYGTLIMSHEQNIVIREFSNIRNQKSTLANKMPVLIKSKYPINIHSNDIELTINPLKGITERKIMYSKFSDEFIEKLVAAAKKHDFLEDVDITDYVLLILAAITTFILPITCGLCFYCIKSSELYQRFKESRMKKVMTELNEQR
jgi:hypothetical protein